MRRPEPRFDIELTEKADLRCIEAAREANDRFRRTLSCGAVQMTAGLVALGVEAQRRIIEAVRAFDDFDSVDPFDPHDLGDFEIQADGPGQTGTRLLIFFRIDRHATGRVLTLMLASEW